MILDGSENSWMGMIHYLKNKVGVVDFANVQGLGPWALKNITNPWALGTYINDVRF